MKLPPPTARPLSDRSPLEQALASEDSRAVQSLLREGADPAQVCSVRLAAAAGSSADAAACARMIHVAVRMKRMNLHAPLPSSRPDSSAVSQQGPAKREGVVSRLAGCFSAGASASKRPEHVGPITQALQAHDIDAATKALDINGRQPAFSSLNRQRDRAIGMLALNETKPFEDTHQKPALRAARLLAREPGVKSMLKEFSYLSNKPGRDVRKNNNFKVDFAGTQEKIVCRHLATYWLMDRPVTANGKIDYSILRDKMKLKDAFDPEDASAYNYYTRSSPINLVENNRFGNFLKSQFQEMAFTDSASKPKRILVSTGVHAMACELKMKEGDDGHPVYTVNFYDPNTTASHRRVRTQDLARIESVTMAQLINDPQRMNEYYPEGKSLSHALVIPEELPRPTPEQLSADSNNSFIESVIPVIALQRLDATGYTHVLRSEIHTGPWFTPKRMDGSIS
jgi:hypothetical protein